MNTLGIGFRGTFLMIATTSLQYQHPNEQWWRVGKHATDRLDQMRKLTLFITPKNVGPWRPTEPHQVTRPKRSGQERSQEDSARGLQHRRHREKSVGRQKGENGEAQTAQAHTQQMVMMIRPALLCLYLLLCPSDIHSFVWWIYNRRKSYAIRLL